MIVSELYDDIDFFCGSTSATYSPTNKLRNINIHYADVARQIWDSSDGWWYDDSNATTLPIAKTTLVHNQQDYSLPSTAQRLHRVEVKDKNGLWQLILPVTEEEILTADPEFYSGTGFPIYYRPMGRSVLFYPRPSSAYCTLASGVAFSVDRDVTPLTGTAQTPGFATPFHRILSLAGSIDFMQDEKAKQALAAQKARLEQGMARFYGKRFIEKPARINPASRKFKRQYE